MIADNIKHIRQTLPSDVRLVCVSKYHTIEQIKEAYEIGEREFGESRVQELTQKYSALPKDISWHFIGHLQTNKVKYIIPFIHLIHSVDSEKLLKTINHEASKAGRTVDVMLELKVATEPTKTGMSEQELLALYQSYLDCKTSEYQNVHIAGMMTMASFTDDEEQINSEFSQARATFSKLQSLANEPLILSMGMSDDYHIALRHGSNMVRIGSAIFE